MKNINHERDLKIESLLEELNEFTQEQMRLYDICYLKAKEYQEKMQEYDNAIMNKDLAIKQAISAMIDKSDMKEIATEYNYKMPSGKIFIKKDKSDIKLKDNYEIQNIPKQYTKTETKVKWGELKKALKIIDNNIICADTGEIVDFAEIEIKPGGELQIRLK